MKYPIEEKPETKKLSEHARVKAFQQLRVDLEGGARLTFDYIAMIFFAAIIAATGLATDNVVAIISSMLISPLMGPILGCTFGCVSHYQARKMIRLLSAMDLTDLDDQALAKLDLESYKSEMSKNRSLIARSLLTETAGLVICVLVGFVVGLLFATWADDWGWPNDEMASRGETPAKLFSVGLAIAIPSGGAVALSVTGGNAGGLVGVAISASLLPPAVNAGMCWGIACISRQSLRFASIGGYSLLLTLLNILAIIVVAFGVFLLKEVVDPKNSRTREKVNQLKDMPMTQRTLQRRQSQHDLRTALAEKRGGRFGERNAAELKAQLVKADLLPSPLELYKPLTAKEEALVAQQKQKLHSPACSPSARQFAKKTETEL